MSRFVSPVALGALLAFLSAALPAAAATDLVFLKHKVHAAVPAPPSGAALAVLAKPPVRSSIASQRVYFVMTDRYANGSPANDRGGR
ncbi:MAG: hypothetical protein ACRDNB_05005, partial [Gaiellaceae bacterium]